MDTVGREAVVAEAREAVKPIVARIYMDGEPASWRTCIHNGQKVTPVFCRKCVADALAEAWILGRVEGVK